MKKLSIILMTLFLLFTVMTFDVNAEDCGRMLWRPDLNKAVKMFCLGDKLYPDSDTEKTGDYWMLVAEAYHPTGKQSLITFWDYDYDCVADFTMIYKLANINGQEAYVFVNYIDNAEVALAMVRAEEKKYGVSVYREADCAKKIKPEVDPKRFRRHDVAIECNLGIT